MSTNYESYYEKTANTPMKKREWVSYIFGGIGDSALSGLVSTFFMIYATVVMQISPFAIGIILLVTKFIDAFFDPIVGILIDNTRTRYGKLRPYLLVGGLFWAGMTFFLFFNPNFTSEAMKIGYVATVYILWGLGYALFDVPYWCMSTVMTPDINKRNVLISLTRSATALGALIVTLSGGLLVTYFAPMPYSGQGYSYVAWLFSVIAAISFIILFFVSKERIKPTANKMNLKSIIQILKVNKPLQTFIISQLLGVTGQASSMLFSYYAIYNLGSISLLSYLMLPMMIGFFVTPFIVPKLLKKIELTKLIYINAIVTFTVGALFFVVGYENLTYVFIVFFIFGFCGSIGSTLSTVFLVESIDYVEWNTGHRAEAIMFSIQSLAAKIISAFGSFISGLVLTVIGFDKAASIQSSGTLQGLFIAVAFGGGISAILGAIPFLMSKFKGSERQRILRELQERRENNA